MAELVYIDESISKGVDRKPNRMLVVGVVVDESAVRTLSERFEGIAWKHLGYVPADFEIHANEIWGGRGHWKDKQPHELLAVLDSIVQVLVDLDIHVVHSTINLIGLHARWSGSFDMNAYLLGLQFMLEKLDGVRVGDPRRILIADRAKEHELRATKMVGRMQWRPLGGEVPGIQLRTVIDSIHFVDSKNSAGVQLADSVAYLIQRSRRTGPEHPTAREKVLELREHIRSKTLAYREPWP